MDKDEQIRERMKKLAAMVGPTASLLGTVKAVQKSDYTCTITDDDDDTGLDYEEVRLRPMLDDTLGLTIFPKEGTWALAIRIENDEDWMLIDCCEVESVELVIGETELNIDKDVLSYKNDKTEINIDKESFDCKIDNLEIKAKTKILLKVGGKSLGGVLDTFFTKMATAQVLTPAGPGSFKPDTIADIQTAKADLATILES